MLDGAPRLLDHDLAQTGIVRRRRAIRDGEVPVGVIAVQEDGDVKDLARAVIRIRRQWHFAVRRDIEGHLQQLCSALSENVSQTTNDTHYSGLRTAA